LGQELSIDGGGFTQKKKKAAGLVRKGVDREKTVPKNKKRGLRITKKAKFLNAQD